MTVKSHDTLWWSVTFFKGFLSVPKWSRQLTKITPSKSRLIDEQQAEAWVSPEKMGGGRGDTLQPKCLSFLVYVHCDFLLKSSLFQMNLYQWLMLQPSTFFNFFPYQPQKLEGEFSLCSTMTLENNVVVNNSSIGKSTWGISGQHRFLRPEAWLSVMFW